LETHADPRLRRSSGPPPTSALTIIGLEGAPIRPSNLASGNAADDGATRLAPSGIDQLLEEITTLGRALEGHEQRQ